MSNGIPTWAAVIIAAGALVGALAVLWTKIVRPTLRFAASVEEMLPLLRSLTLTFRDNPTAFGVLDDIAREFRADSGSTLRDVVNRLETASVESKTAAELLKVGVEASRQLAVRDREDYREMLKQIASLTTRVDLGQRALNAQGGRIEAAAAVVAEDLAASHRRAEEAGPGEPGTAADAAAKKEPPPP